MANKILCLFYVPVNVFLLLRHLESVTATCPDGFTLSNGGCFFFSRLKRNYCKAQAVCRSLGGELLTGNMIHALKLAKLNQPHLIGMTDLLDETKDLASPGSSFRWTNGSFAPNLFTGTNLV